MIIVLVGESACGKSTVQKLIEKENPSFTRIISYTTRPKRTNEKDGVDYHFVSKDTFDRMKQNGDFIEFAQYRGWDYGSAKKDYENNSSNHIAVLTPQGCRSLKRIAEINSKISGVYSVYINVDRRSRMIKILNRGDDIDEAYRRNLSDVGQFDGFEKEADIVINNENFNKSPQKIYDEIFDRLISKSIAFIAFCDSIEINEDDPSNGFVVLDDVLF